MTPIHVERETVDRLIAQEGLVRTGVQLGVAALLYTYRCTIACRHCCFGCGRGAPDVHMATDRAVAHLEALHQIGRVIHIAGGEAMLYWDDLREVLARAAARGCQPHFIETNCSFATSDAVVRERIAFMKDHGVVGILLSADAFHQAFVPPEHFLRVRRLSREAFGPQNVWASESPDEEIMDLAAIARDEHRLGEFVRRHPPTLVGAAQRELRKFFDEHPIAELPHGTDWRDPCPGPDCAVVFSKARIWELHIDPYDNIQTNCGIILGKATETTPLDLLKRGPGEANEIVRMVCRGGPVALAEMARRRHNYVLPQKACTRCDFCYTVRKFLRPFYPDVLGPHEVYTA